MEQTLISSHQLTGRIAIVTGASGSIGRAIALYLHSLGAKLVIHYASKSDQALLLVAELNSIRPSSAISIEADVSDPDQVKLLFDRTEEQGSKIHVLVACAGIIDSKLPTLVNTEVEDWDRIFSVNTRGSFLCCREAAKRLVKGGGGRIITVSTSLVGVNLPGYGAYTASKAAVEAMTRVLAKELKGTGITANCVAPGPVATEFFLEGKSEETINRLVDACPLGRLGDPNDMCGIVGLLASDAGEWINGQIIRVNGGFVV